MDDPRPAVLVSVAIILVGFELDEAEPVPEGIAEAHAARPAPVDVPGLLLRARRQRPPGGGVHVGHHQVEMHRRPVTRVLAIDGRRLDRGRAAGLLQQVDGGRGTGELGRVLVEGATVGESQRARVEPDGGRELRDVDVDDEFQRIPLG